VKLVENPPNPYESAHREWLEPPPEVRLEVYEEQARSILAENDSPDIPFRWSCNPYRGCQHACAYCYARATHEYLGFGAGTDFETRLVVKVNAPELLAKALSRRNLAGEYINFSGVTDCYQPLEAVYRLTGRCLEVCLAKRNPVGVVTKSYLIVRDAEVLAELNRVAGAQVYVSIPMADRTISKAMEPQAPTPERRFEAIRRLADAGVPVGVMVAPVIPGLTDRDIPVILQRAREAGATRASCMPLRLAGNVREVFQTRLRREMPLRAERVLQRLRDIRHGQLNDSRFGWRMRGDGPYWESVIRLFDVWRTRLRFQQEIPSSDGAAGAVFCENRLVRPRTIPLRQLRLFE